MGSSRSSQRSPRSHLQEIAAILACAVRRRRQDRLHTANPERQCPDEVDLFDETRLSVLDDEDAENSRFAATNFRSEATSTGWTLFRSLQFLRQVVSVEDLASTEFPSAFLAPQFPSGGRRIQRGLDFG